MGPHSSATPGHPEAGQGPGAVATAPVAVEGEWVLSPFLVTSARVATATLSALVGKGRGTVRPWARWGVQSDSGTRLMGPVRASGRERFQPQRRGIVLKTWEQMR